MNKVELQDLVGGALQEKFSKSFEKVIENLQDPNTPFKNKRGITIKLTFAQNESRDDVKVGIDVTEKLSPQAPMETAFYIGKDLKTGSVYAEEYGRQIKGQMNIEDYSSQQVVDGKTIDTDTGEVIEEPKSNAVINFKQLAQ